MMKSKICKSYIDDSFDIFKKIQKAQFTEHLNNIDHTGSIKFTDEPAIANSILFLDAYVTRKVYGSLKVKVYRKKTHTNQYLNFKSHHPLG